MKHKFFFLILTLAALLVLGCGGGGEDTTVQGSSTNPNPSPQPTGTPTPQAPNLRVINMFGASDGFSLQIDGVTIDTDFQLTETTPYIELDAAVHTVTVLRGEETVLTQQVTLAVDEFKTVVVQGDTVLTGIVLTDNTAPVAGQLNARLVNSTPEEEFACSLLTNPQFLLLGPVGAFQATNYSLLDLNALSSATELVLFFESDVEQDFIFFNSVEGSGADLVGAIGAQISTSGTNMTILTTYDETGTQYLLFVLDDAIGDTSILSISNEI